MTKQSFLITGASDGIGAVYADRLARRGHDLILVARRADKLGALAEQLRNNTGVSVDVIAADLANPDDLARVGSLGLLRFQDAELRLHALTKADNVGLGFKSMAVA